MTAPSTAALKANGAALACASLAPRRPSANAAANSAHIPPIDYAQPKKPKRSGVKSDVWLPDYLHEAVRIQSIKSKISLRTYCIMGLQAIGFEVRPEDLIPDHRRKPRQ